MAAKRVIKHLREVDSTGAADALLEKGWILVRCFNRCEEPVYVLGSYETKAEIEARAKEEEQRQERIQKAVKKAKDWVGKKVAERGEESGLKLTMDPERKQMALEMGVRDMEWANTYSRMAKRGEFHTLINLLCAIVLTWSGNPLGAAVSTAVALFCYRNLLQCQRHHAKWARLAEAWTRVARDPENVEHYRQQICEILNEMVVERRRLIKWK